MRAEKYLNRLLPSFYALEKHRSVPADAQEYRLKQSRDWFNRNTPWPTVPLGPLIAIADANIHTLAGVTYTLYVILLRPVIGSTAVAQTPHLEAGKETLEGWSRAFANLPQEVEARIVALVSDGHRGLLCNALWRGWRIQRCHFHLLKALMVRRSTKSTRGYSVTGKILLSLAVTILTTLDQRALQDATNRIEEIGWMSTRGTLRRVVSGFVRSVDEYRTYLAHPELLLPRTSNAVESFISGLEKMCSHARGFRTKESFKAWVEAYVKRTKSITCNEAHQPNYCG